MKVLKMFCMRWLLERGSGVWRLMRTSYDHVAWRPCLNFLLWLYWFSQPWKVINSPMWRFHLIVFWVHQVVRWARTRGGSKDQRSYAPEQHEIDIRINKFRNWRDTGPLLEKNNWWFFGKFSFVFFCSSFVFSFFFFLFFPLLFHSIFFHLFLPFFFFGVFLFHAVQEHL